MSIEAFGTKNHIDLIQPKSRCSRCILHATAALQHATSCLNAFVHLIIKAHLFIKTTAASQTQQTHEQSPAMCSSYYSACILGKMSYNFIIHYTFATHTHTHSVGLLVSPKVESLIVTEWDYLKPACGRKNTQTMTGWAAACSLLRKAQYEMTLQTKCSFNLSTA